MSNIKVGNKSYCNERHMLLDFRYIADSDMVDDPRYDIAYKGFGEVPGSEIFRYYRCLPKIDNASRTELELGLLKPRWTSFSATLQKFGKKHDLACVSHLIFDVGEYYSIFPLYLQDHVWVKGDVSSIPSDIKFGDRIDFEGNIYLYRAGNGRLDYAIKDFKFVGKSKDQSLPSILKVMEETRDQWIERQVCKCCFYYEQCPLTNCYEPLHHNIAFSRIFTMAVMSAIYHGYELLWSDLEHLLIKPDKIEQLRDFLAGWRYGTLDGKERLSLFDSFFCQSHAEWLAYMDFFGFNQNQLFVFY